MKVLAAASRRRSLSQRAAELHPIYNNIAAHASNCDLLKIFRTIRSTLAANNRDWSDRVHCQCQMWIYMAHSRKKPLMC